MPKFQKGQSDNPTGRPKGCKNKHTANFQAKLNQLFINNDFCPIEKLVDLSKNDPGNAIQLVAAKELMNYYRPKLRAITITANQQNPVSFQQ